MYNDFKVPFFRFYQKQTFEFLAVRAGQASGGHVIVEYHKVLLSYFTIEHIYTDLQVQKLFVLSKTIILHLGGQGGDTPKRLEKTTKSVGA